jgi:hypothetical protein
MATRTVAVTDYSFDNLDIERAVLEPLECRVVDQKSGKDQAKLIALVRDADCNGTRSSSDTASGWTTWT